MTKICTIALCLIFTGCIEAPPTTQDAGPAPIEDLCLRGCADALDCEGITGASCRLQHAGEPLGCCIVSTCENDSMCPPDNQRDAIGGHGDRCDLGTGFCTE